MVRQGNVPDNTEVAQVAGNAQVAGEEKSREKALDFLEVQIPALSASAVTVAYWAALAAGHSVLEAEDGAVVEVFPDGTRRTVKRIAPGVPAVPGTQMSLR